MGFGLEIEIEVWLGHPMTNNLNIAGNFAGFCSKPATATSCHRLQILRVVHGFLHSLHERSELESEQTPSAVTISHQQGSTPCWRTTDIKSRELQGLPPKTCHLQVEENSPHKQCLWLVPSAFTHIHPYSSMVDPRRTFSKARSTVYRVSPNVAPIQGGTKVRCDFQLEIGLWCGDDTLGKAMGVGHLPVIKHGKKILVF